MSDEQWLREGLSEAVPAPPAAPDRAAGARVKARRARRTTILAAGCTAASVVLVAGGMALLGGSRATPDGATDRGPTAPGVTGCPAEPVDTRTQAGPDHIPDGAISVRLCRGFGGAIEVPDDALVSGVDEIAAAINGLAAPGPNVLCTGELGPGYQLVFAYADGTTQVAAGELYGCRPVVVNGTERLGADAPWKRFIDLLRAQRSGATPPATLDHTAIDCDQAGRVPTLGRPQELAVAAICVEDTLNSGVWLRADISSADLATLLTDMAANTERNAAYVDCDPGRLPRIVGFTSWGDRIDIRAGCGNGRFATDPDDHSVWSPGPEAAAIIDRLVGEAR
ncbi:hypothetical protein FHP29_09885 [Nocardioides albidus]|uniref:Uncharacterized protein n=1 Tax=Nocardioides albidus TaxID=1517589 RepID=A0A5C4VWN8_9ACTN|nr:hypothetical protein [Nocardioides albidus]TNM40362.1 hypothetical protein FHP29_09885 [Nocardioides albidus]